MHREKRKYEGRPKETKQTNADDPANPGLETISYGLRDEFNLHVYHPGLTKREYFAAQALMGIVQRGANLVETDVKLAVKYADHLITQLNKERNI